MKTLLIKTLFIFCSFAGCVSFSVFAIKNLKKNQKNTNFIPVVEVEKTKEDQILDLQKNILSLINKNENTNTTKRYGDKKNVDNNELNENSKIIEYQKNFSNNDDDEIIKSLTDNLKDLMKVKKSLQEKRKEYFNSVFNLFSKVKQEMQNVSLIINNETIKEQDKSPQEFKKINLKKINNQQISFSHIENNLIHLTMGEEPSKKQEWIGNGSIFKSFEIKKDIFHNLTSDWGISKLTISNEPENLKFSYKFNQIATNEDEEEKVFGEIIEIIFTEKTNQEKITKLNEKINSSWDGILQTRKAFSNEIKKINPNYLTYKWNNDKKENMCFNGGCGEFSVGDNLVKWSKLWEISIF